MSDTLEDRVRLMESAFFMSYPHDVYARLRAEAPVFHSERDGIWAISKYEDVRHISRNPEVFANGYHVFSAAAAIRGDTSAPPEPPDSSHSSGMPPDAVARRLSLVDEDGNDSLVFADGARHAFLRKVASYAFKPRAVARLDAEVEALTAKALADIEPGVEVDFIDTVAAPVPIIMIARLLGVSDGHVGDFRRWSDAFSELGDESLQGGGDPELLNQRLAATEEFNEFFTEQLAARRVQPRDDLLTAMVQAEWDGRAMTMGEMLMMTTILLIAGNETTRGLLSGTGCLLADHPDQHRLLRASPELVPQSIEEFLRLVSPVTHMCRTATVDTEVRGVPIAKGDFLCLLYPSANRDEEVWKDADLLDVTRRPDPAHMAFGFAEHFCLGAALARREARIVITQLVQRFRSWHVVGGLTRAQNHMTPGITRMPVVFER
jgi:cytochrome P450